LSAQQSLALLARLPLHIQRMPLAYVLKNAHFRIIEWNPMAERIFGYPREEMLGTGPVRHARADLARRAGGAFGLAAWPAGARDRLGPRAEVNLLRQFL
jgi:PAS domain-containing protein